MQCNNRLHIAKSGYDWLMKNKPVQASIVWNKINVQFRLSTSLCGLA